MVRLTDEQRRGLSNADSQWPLRVGVVTPVAAKLSMAQPAFGALRSDGETSVWTTSVIADGADGIRLHITGLDLPEDAELAIYNKRGEAFTYSGQGPLGSGEFWTHTMSGSVAYLQLSGADIIDVRFEIADLGYMDNPVTIEKRPPWEDPGGGEGNLCSYNAECIENAGCTSSSEVSDAVNAIGHMRYVDGQYMYVCTGGLIANGAGRPYFLTANHCISTSNVASSLETYFFYAIGCNDSCLPQWTAPDTPRTLGSSIASTNETGDYTLLELDEPAPAGTVMMGWDTTPIAHANGTMLYRISHPSGAPQAYSTHQVEDSYGSCGGSWPIPDWIYSQDVTGATEGGSSGSPVLNGAGQIVGQLSGGCGYNLNDTCDELNNRTVDGAFAGYYDEIAGLLGSGPTYTDNDDDGYYAEVDDCNDNDDSIYPGAPEICGDGIDQDCNGSDLACPCTDNDDDGYCPEDGDCNDNDPFVNPGMAEDCFDLIDNDCDGDIDDADSECQACLPLGAACTSGDECCSGRCHPRRGCK
jgi:V8-like Glu-specific endopeptidase